MTKCTGIRCQMQVGYKVDECDYKDCHYRTEPITNAQKIRSMSDEELAENMSDWQCWGGGLDPKDWLKWLQQPAE